jgi:hypothetical protein
MANRDEGFASHVLLLLVSNKYTLFRLSSKTLDHLFYLKINWKSFGRRDHSPDGSSSNVIGGS